MGPPATAASGGGRRATISQEAFEALVKENMEDLGMDPDEALDDAIQTLSLQGVDLSGIIKCVPGVSSAKDNLIVQSLDRLKDVAVENVNLEEMVGVLDRFYELCEVEGSDNAAIATKNGAVELLCRICDSLDIKFEKPLVSALKALSCSLHDIQSRETFRQSEGPQIVVRILRKSSKVLDLLDSGFSVIGAASTGDEILKESFMDLKVDELILQVLQEENNGFRQSLYDAIRVLLTPDDNRVLASQVFGYARRFAKVGIADALVKALTQERDFSSLGSICTALKAIAVNDEICKSISESGGLEAIFKCINGSIEHNNKTIARVCCSLLSQLAGSDSNKIAILDMGGLDRLMKLSSRFFEDPSVQQDVMTIITVLSLRSPENAARAIEAGVGDLVIQAMQKFPTSFQMQRQACFMIRNLVVRNQDNRTILLNNGIEKLIRKAKASHESCKDAATAALRDLGLDDYNM